MSNTNESVSLTQARLVLAHIGACNRGRTVLMSIDCVDAKCAWEVVAHFDYFDWLMDQLFTENAPLYYRVSLALLGLCAPSLEECGAAQSELVSRTVELLREALDPRDDHALRIKTSALREEIWRSMQDNDSRLAGYDGLSLCREALMPADSGNIGNELLLLARGHMHGAPGGMEYQEAKDAVMAAVRAVLPFEEAWEILQGRVAGQKIEDDGWEDPENE